MTSTLAHIGLPLGAVGIAAGIVGQIADNSIHNNNPLLIAGSIVFGAGLIAAAITSTK